MEITPLGDSALIVQVRDRFEDAPDKALSEVLRVFRRLEAAAIPGVIELAPAYTTVGVFFDPIRVINEGAGFDRVIDSLTQTICRAVSHHSDRKQKPAGARTIEIPVCYDAKFALDIEQVAQHAQISAKEVVDLHSAAEYRVNCIGFTPGFPFLAGLPKKLATPRRTTPRKEIPAGSVGIGGAQTGVYPLPSPGGWSIIGRTPLRLFDSSKHEPALLRAGDRVRFRVIDLAEFEASTK